MSDRTRVGTLYILKKDHTAKSKERTSVSLKSKGSDDVHVLKGMLFEQGAEKASNPKKIILTSCDNPQVYVTCSVNDVEEISGEEHDLLVAISTADDRLKVSADKNWLAEGLSLKPGNIVHIIKQKGLHENTEAVVRYKGQLPGQNGLWFGVELLDQRGRGSSDGVFRQKRYFKCDQDCGLFISLNKLRLNTRAIQPNSPTSKDKDMGDYTENLKVGDRIVWYSDTGPEHGIVKWLGVLPDAPKGQFTAGVEFNNPIGTGTGKYKEKQLFKAKYKHASLVPIAGLIREEDFYQNAANNSFSEEDFKAATGPPAEYTTSIPGAQSAVNHLVSKHKKQEESYVDSQKQIEIGIKNGIVNGHSASKSSPSAANKSYTNHSNHREGGQSQGYVDHREGGQSQGYVDSANKTHLNGAKPKAIYSDSTVFANRGRNEADGFIQSSSLTPDSNNQSHDFEIGTMVEVNGNPKRYGVIKWIGTLPQSKDPSKKCAGLEMEDEHPSYNDGKFGGIQFFDCPDKRGLFVYIRTLRQDSRFQENPRYLERTISKAFGSVDSPDVDGNLGSLTEEDLLAICGRRKGIQGHHNSCYLDATLFTMFAFSEVFDTILYRQGKEDDHAMYNEVQSVLKSSIVNPLRQNCFVRADKIVKLRTLLDRVGSVKGMMTEEKDPEEFLSLLLQTVLKAEPFIKLSSGQESYFYQLFIEKDERLRLPTTQQLLELSFMQSDIKLSEIPSCLILQMPRFGKDYKMYERIMPSLELDITDVLEYAPRSCHICGGLAEWECKECYHQWGEGLSTIAFCTVCKDKSHSHHRRQKHLSKPIKIPTDFKKYYKPDPNSQLPRETMELFGVICIQTSHYVAFVKAGSGPEAPWVFFDSMADRMGEMNGYNIPEVMDVTGITRWLDEGSIESIIAKSDREIDEWPRRLLCDAYVCLYQKPDINMYR